METSTKEPAPRATLAFSLQPLAFPAACLALALWLVVLPARADVLIGTNGDRFTGKVLEETADSVVFESELGGKLTIPRNRIREIQHTPPPITDNRSYPLSDAGGIQIDSRFRCLFTGPVSCSCARDR